MGRETVSKRTEDVFKIKCVALALCVVFLFSNLCLAQQGTQDQVQPLPDNPAVLQQPQTEPSHIPVGTAVAPAIPVTGVAAFSPAGAAIAPAKQHRARTILISMGIVLGTAAAVGTVVALANASPSHPAGTR